MERRIETAGAAETEALAAELAAVLRPGDLVVLEGELGSGKTTFVRGACRALGVTGAVTSPTFTIGQRYSGPVPVSHLDLYRIESLGDEDPGLLDDYLAPDMVTFVEWPPGSAEALAAPASVTYRIELAHAGGDRRSVRITRGVQP